MEDSESLKSALEFAKEKHKGQKRIGGDDYIVCLGLFGYILGTDISARKYECFHIITTSFSL